MADKSFVIDGSSILFRYLFALPEMTTADGIIVQGLMGFCSAIMSIIKKNKGMHFFVAMDKCSQNFRKESFPEYKQNRKKINMNVREQIDLSIEFCRMTGIPVEYHANYEADDIIASFVASHPSKNFVVVSVDKDLCQLIKENVVVYNPFKKTIMNKEKVLEQYGVPPEKFDLFLALCGDSSDNIPGIDGIGPKTAAKILQKFSTIEEIKNNVKEFNFDTLEHMLLLTKLRTDVDFSHIPVTPLNLDLNAARTFFTQMNFHSLMHYLH